MRPTSLARRAALFVVLLVGAVACGPSRPARVVDSAPVVTRAVVADAGDPLADRFAVFYPSDPSDLLHDLLFPDWWPVPDKMQTDPAGRPTVVEIDVGIGELGHMWRVTSFVVAGNDTYDAITRWTRKLALAGDVGAPGEHVTSGTVDGADTTTYRHDFGASVGHLELVVQGRAEWIPPGQILVTLRQFLELPPGSPRLVPGLPRFIIAALPVSPVFVSRSSRILVSTFGGARDRNYQVELAAPRSEAASVRPVIEAWAASTGATVRANADGGVTASGGRLPGLADGAVSKVVLYAGSPAVFRDEFATRVSLRVDDAGA